MYLTKKALFNHLENELYCRLGASTTHGVGVFAFRSIPSGINPFKSWLDIKELHYSVEELKALTPNTRELLNTFCYHSEDTVCVPVVRGYPFLVSHQIVFNLERPSETSAK